MQKNKMVSIMAIVIIVVAGVFFYGGMKYTQAKSKNAQMGVNTFGQNRAGGNMRPGMIRGGGIGGGFVTGEILSKDATSMTIKLQDGGSKIVFFTSGSQVMKSVAGTVDDVVVGKTVMINGKANPDGSVNAEQIQIRTAQPVK